MTANFWLSVFICLLALALFSGWFCRQAYLTARACDKVCEAEGIHPDAVHQLGKAISRLDRTIAWAGSLCGSCLVAALLSLGAYLKTS